MLDNLQFSIMTFLGDEILNENMTARSIKGHRDLRVWAYSLQYGANPNATNSDVMTQLRLTRFAKRVGDGRLLP
jgi:hypothetical protein